MLKGVFWSWWVLNKSLYNKNTMRIKSDRNCMWKWFGKSEGIVSIVILNVSLFVFIYLKRRKRERASERERFYSLIYCPNASNNWVWVIADARSLKLSLDWPAEWQRTQMFEAEVDLGLNPDTLMWVPQTASTHTPTWVCQAVSKCCNKGPSGDLF